MASLTDFFNAITICDQNEHLTYLNMRTKYVIGNWKMNTDLSSGLKLVEEIFEIAQHTDSEHIKVVLCSPFTHLSELGKFLQKLPHFSLGAQNTSHKKNGALTGEISVEMLKSVGVEYIIVGHSERRDHFRESDEMIKAKVDLILEEGMKPVFCCGEPKEIREADQQNAYVLKQIENALFHLPAEQITKVVLAYEPVWAIGTGLTANTDQIQAMHQTIRQALAQKYGQTIADEISILYGGSCKASNAPEIFGLTDVDGGLIGGASLIANEFVNIISAHQK